MLKGLTYLAEEEDGRRPSETTWLSTALPSYFCA